MSFFEEIQRYDWDRIGEQIYAKTPADVEIALHTRQPDLDDFQALISPAATKYLPQMMEKSMAITRKRFGKILQLYIPVYLSNSCTNTCVYCGFNHANYFDRTILTVEEVKREAEKIKSHGFEHILLVTGEDHLRCGTDYLLEIIDQLREKFAQISIEVQPLGTEDYSVLARRGLNTVYIYQETYNQKNYKRYHPGGKKANFRYRLETPDRIGEAGVHKVGLGCLLGLEDWRIDSYFTALHLSYLEKKYWKTRYSISFPRLRPHAGSFSAPHRVGQRDLVQLITAYRICNEQVELSLSTREDARFRDNMLKFGVTAFSAGSKTNPGGYSEENESLEQFSVHDDRSPAAIVEMIKQNGYEVVWKDWDACLQ